MTDPVAAAEVIRIADRALGSRLLLTLVGVAGDAARRIWAATRAEFDAVDRSLSGFRTDSGITRLNEAAGLDAREVDRRLYAALSLADRAWRVTDGRFDPRVHGALARLHQPGPHEISRQGRSQLGTTTTWLRRRPRSRAVALTEPVDLHGLGKGLALRWAWHSIQRSLPAGAGALLDAGGDLVGRSPAADGGDWLIGIDDPGGGMNPIVVLAFARGSVCTSATRIGRWRDRDGREHHHLVDPASGESAMGGLVSVTVAGPDPAWTEIRTKELFLHGRAGVAARARALGLAAWWVTDDGVVEMTPHARLVTRWP